MTTIPEIAELQAGYAFGTTVITYSFLEFLPGYYDLNDPVQAAGFPWR